MASTMISMSQPSGPDLKTICDDYYRDLSQNADPCKIIYYPNEENPTSCLMVVEKYFFRTNGFGVLTSYVYEHEMALCLDIISAGSGTGILGIDIGANSDFLFMAESIATKYDFKTL